MAAPSSDVHICNLALKRLGVDTITSLANPVGKSAETCALHYDQTRRFLLRKFIFNFAKRLVTLTEATDTTPAHGFGTAYRLPNDNLRLLAIGDISLVNGDLPAGLYELSEGYIFTDSGTEDGLNIAYIFDAKVVTKYDPLFVNLLKLQLANDMAYAFTLKTGVKQAIEQELEKAEVAAAAVAGQEKPPRRVERSRLRDCRRIGGFPRDNSRYP